MADTKIAMGDHRDLLDIIDSLRSQGVSHYVGLPEIIVCGDQSAGKSSVLEAISGMPFPTKDGLCTRFATELVLRRSPEGKTKVSIIPGESRYGEDKERLETWQPKASIDKEGLGSVTDEAKRAMSDGQTSKGEFFEDILSVELTGPTQPHLTMVDLPGLFRRGNKEQSDDDVDIVRAMVERYMARPRSIILTVVSAKYDYVLQEVTLMAKHADPQGLRTMGLITKPDTLDVGSDSESYFVRLARNLEEELGLGWHVLKNRNFEQRNVTSAERDDIERDFFTKGLWTCIDSANCGVVALRHRLSDILKNQILAQLESLVEDVKEGIQDCDERLDRLGPERGTTQQQLSYLLRVSEEYTSLVTLAVDGTYTHRFFGNHNDIKGFQTRLRAVVRNRLSEFADEMRLSGQKQYIVDSESEDEGNGEVPDSPKISRSQYVADVANRIKYAKGRELPGLFNPLIINELFWEQCQPWSGIARVLVDNILESTELTIHMIVRHIAASDVAEGVFKFIDKGLEGLKADLETRVDALFTSTAEHPITDNPQLTENVKRTERARYNRDVRKLLHKMFGAHPFDNPNSKISTNSVEIMGVVDQAFETNMDRFGGSLAVDYMEAYYKASNSVAMTRFIDDVSNLAIEDCLISKLSSLFRSTDVLGLSAEDISGMAGETPESSIERQRLEAKRKILKSGLQSLKSLNKRRDAIKHMGKALIASEDSDQVSVKTRTSSRSQQPSISTNSPDPDPGADLASELSCSPDTTEMSLRSGAWSPEVVTDGFGHFWNGSKE